MSSRLWNACEDRRKMGHINTLYRSVLQEANCFDDDNEMFSNFSFSSTSSNEDANIEPNPFIDVLSDLHELATHQVQRVVYRVVDDDNIDFDVPSKQIEHFSESDCISYFRFTKHDLQSVADQLWPRLSPLLHSDNKNRIAIGDKYIASYETCLCLYLYKMSYPRRLRPDAEKFFGIRKSKLSRMIIFFGEALSRLAVQYLVTPAIWHHRFAYYAHVIREKIPLDIYPNIWGFIDGTIRRTCRPIRFQEVMYTRYKRCHGIKFQSIVTPDGYIACLAGPFVAKRHDARIYRESGISNILQQLMPMNGEGPVYALYGDLAYPQSEYLFGGFVHALPNTPQARFNRAMSSVRIVVEWGFATVLRRWQHLDFTRSMKVFQQPIGQQYINCTFLTNIANCFYGGAINNYFDCDLLTLQQYLALID